MTNHDASNFSPENQKFSINDDTVVRFARGLIRWRWAVIALTLLVTGIAASGLKNLDFASDYRVFFGADNPQLADFERMQKVYTKDDNISFVIKPAKGDVFTPNMLAAIRDLTNAAWKTPFSTRVDSITNYQHSYAEADDLTVRDLVAKNILLTPEAIKGIRNVALSEPLLVNRIISTDGTTTSVNITFNLPQKDLTEIPAVMSFVRNLATNFEAENAGTHVAITGMVALNSAFFEASMADMSTLIPIMYGVLLLTIAVLLRSFTGTLSTMLVIGLSAMTAMGVAGWLGIRLTPPSAVAPTIILTIAIADSIHILVSMFKSMRNGASKKDAIVESIRVNFGPVFLTSLTTIIGFLSLNFSDSPPFGDLGNITAAGVAAAWAYSIFFLPAFMSLLPVRVKVIGDGDLSKGRSGFMDRLADFVIKRQKVLLISTTALVLVLGALIPRIELNDQFVQYFDESVTFRADTDFATENLTGMYQLQWSLPALEAGGISEPQYLQNIQAFEKWLLAQQGVMHVTTMTDTFKKLNKNMHGDDPVWHRLPDERNLAAQYLLLFEMSLPYGLDLNNQINVDKSAMRLIATTDSLTTNELRALDDSGALWLDENLKKGEIHASGPIMMFAYISLNNVRSMLNGTTVALILISLCLAIALRNIKLGIISLVPNLVPAIMAFGIWSIFVGTVDVASSIVTATSLGIIVDATVHFLSKYQRGIREKGFSTEEGVRYAFANVGIALLVTAFVLIAGFTVLTFSTFRLNASMGQLTALAIAAALIADFFLLPALLLTLDKHKQKKNNAKTLTQNNRTVSQPAE
jgi:predicted RND superfamily exporter protein